jgi:hypothetical protein
LVLKPLWNPCSSCHTKVCTSSLMQFLLDINNYELWQDKLDYILWSLKTNTIKNKTWFNSMLILEEVSDSQRNADTCVKLGGIPWISRRYLQQFKIRLLK